MASSFLWRNSTHDVKEQQELGIKNIYYAISYQRKHTYEVYNN